MALSTEVRIPDETGFVDIFHESVEEIIQSDEITQFHTVTQTGRAAFLKHQCQQLFSGGKFSDVTLVVGYRRFQVHKLILATSSTYFEKMFYGGFRWKENNNDEIKLVETPACEEAFEMFLRYFYSGSVTVTKTNVISLVTLADKYDVQGLHEICSQSIARALREKCALEAAFQWLIFAAQMRMHCLQEKCTDLICFNFDRACTLSGWLSLPLEHLLEIVERSDIVTKSEFNVFQAVQRWCLNNSVTDKDLKRILSRVQFKNMTAEELHHVENSELIAAMGVCKEYSVLTPFLNATSSRFVAVENNDQQGGDKPATRQRYYTAGGSQLSTAEFSDTESGKCAQLTPKCAMTSEPEYHKWELGKFGNSSKYQVKLATVSRQYTDNWDTKHLYEELPGDLHLNLAVIIRNQSGHAFVLNRSFVTQIPKIEGQIIAEFPDGCPSYEPRDVWYSFSIEKHEITNSESKPK